MKRDRRKTYEVIMKKSKSLLIQITKETPEARKKRVSSGVKFRAAIFNDKRRKLRDKAVKTEDY